MRNITIVNNYNMEIIESGSLSVEDKGNKVFFVYQEEGGLFPLTVAVYDKRTEELDWNIIAQKEFNKSFKLTTFDKVEEDIIDYIKNYLQNNGK